MKNYLLPFDTWQCSLKINQDYSTRLPVNFKVHCILSIDYSIIVLTVLWFIARKTKIKTHWPFMKLFTLFSSLDCHLQKENPRNKITTHLCSTVSQWNYNVLGICIHWGCICTGEHPVTHLLLIVQTKKLRSPTWVNKKSENKENYFTLHSCPIMRAIIVTAFQILKVI